MSKDTINLTLKVWRQKNANDKGHFETYDAKNISVHASFLEMLDVVNLELEREGKEPIAFDHDCREGICGTCGAVVDGRPHGPHSKTTLCQMHMRHYNDGDTIVIEPFRAKAFPVLKDLMVDRQSLDRVTQSGGFISVKTGSAQDANTLPIPKQNADLAFNAAQCIGCGACIAACPNASAMLYVAAKVSHFSLLPQGQAERTDRVLNMVDKMDEEGFGNCSNEYQCQAACPKDIDVAYIARMNREYLRSSFANRGA